MRHAIIYIITSLILVLSSVAGYSQTESYYGWDGELKELHPIEGEFSIILTRGDNNQGLWTHLQEEIPSIRHKEISSKNGRLLYRISTDKRVDNIQELKNKVSKRKGLAHQIAAILPVFDGGSQVLVPDNTFMIKLKDISDIKKLNKLNGIHNVNIHKQYQSIPTMFALQLDGQANKDIFDIARLYFENLNAEWSAPNFYRNWEKSSSITDPYFGYQYYMSQIKAQLAWDINTGDDQVIVAVVDDGVEAHEDLPAGRILPGYAHDNGDEEPLGNEAHGMAVAGIIAASHNDDGIAGLAPEIEIIPVRIFGDRGQFVGDVDVSDAFDFAITNGADIINNSWGSDPTDTEFQESPGMNQFIEDHSDDHLFIFSSGNDIPGNAIAYPGYLDGVFTVGAVDQSDDVQSYSSTGSELNLVAPSGKISPEPSTDQCLGILDEYFTYELKGNVWTLDQDGADGVNPGDTGTEDNCRNTYNWSMPQGVPTPHNGYSAHFGGTSAAAPQAAGVAALMLSIDPSLTIAEVQTILENTADEVSGMSGQSFTNEYGHGRLNAYEAVKEAMPNQYNNVTFYSSTTLPNFSRLKGTNYISYFGSRSLTVSAGNVAVIEGSLGGGPSSELNVNGQVIIDESATINTLQINVGSTGELIIHEGATLSFDSGQGIEADGVIIMNGTNSNRITLEASGSSNWDGIEINNVDSSAVSFVDIEDAVNGISSYNVSGLAIREVEVFNSTWDGFRFINTSTSSPAGGFGFIRADGNGTYGVYYDGGSNDELTNSIMVNNPSAGLYLTGGASLEGVVNSRIYDGGTNGIQANGSSYLEINSSSIHDNNYRDAYAYSSTIDASGNWWGTAPPSPGQFEEVSGGSIDYSSYLFFDPLPGGFQKQGNSNGNESKVKTSGHTVGEINNVASLRKALSGFKGEAALTELNRISGPELSPELNQWTKVIQVELHQRLGNHLQAILTANSLLASQVVSADIRTTMGRRLFYSYLLGTQDMQAAEATLVNLEQWGETEEELKQLSWLLERHKKEASSGDDKESTQSTAQETEVQLSNYPNPFNPSTVIKYELPQNSTVRLQVFDMLGREVVTLVDEQQSAGEYSATFDASKLSSGIYIYRLQAGNSVIIKQMTLIK